MMTRSKTIKMNAANADAANVANADVANTANATDNVPIVYPNMFDRWRLPL
jgi:hypothetical protein